MEGPKMVLNLLWWVVKQSCMTMARGGGIRSLQEGSWSHEGPKCGAHRRLGAAG